jgi:hypothetical protein
MASALAKAIAVPTMGSCFSSHLGASWRVECSPSVPVRFSTVPKNVMASPAIPPDLVVSSPVLGTLSALTSKPVAATTSGLISVGCSSYWRWPSRTRRQARTSAVQSSPRLASGGDGLLGWAVAVDDVDAARGGWDRDHDDQVARDSAQA